MKKKLAALAVILATVGVSVPAMAGEGSVDGSMGSASYVIGLRFGAGDLKFNGETRHFRVGGLSILSVGITGGNFTGKVFNLNNIADFEGSYSLAEAGIAWVGGINVQRWVNDKGVVIEVHGVEIGAELRLGGGGLNVTFSQT